MQRGVRSFTFFLLFKFRALFKILTMICTYCLGGHGMGAAVPLAGGALSQERSWRFPTSQVSSLAAGKEEAFLEGVGHMGFCALQSDLVHS